jgi:phosphoribosylaminoimidazole-succinocarboxamide synthase
MARRKKIYEGKAKILYEGTEPGTFVQYFKDDATAGDGAKHAQIDGKGVLNNRLSEFFMNGLNQIGVPTHFIRRINMCEQLIRQVEIIPLEVVVRNVAAGSISKRLGIAEGTALPRPIVEYYYKDDALHDPMVSEEHIIAFGWASQQDLDDIVALALRVNDFGGVPRARPPHGAGWAASDPTRWWPDHRPPRPTRAASTDRPHRPPRAAAPHPSRASTTGAPC